MQDLRAQITWKQCAELLAEFGDGNSVVINGKVYCGGGVANSDDAEYTVYCYDTSQDKWTTLPPLPVKWFGLGLVNGELVAVGGWRMDREDTNEVCTYDERSQKWKQTIPPMPTARRTLGVLSLQSALVVAGGYQGRYGDTPSSYTAAVEIFKPDTLQWYRTDRLPTACRDISLVAIGNTHACYALGGCNDMDLASSLNQALYASINDLLGNAIPANQATHSGSSDTQSIWKTLPNTPTYEPHAAVLAGNLLAIGGEETPKGRSDKQEIYLYSPSTNSWIYISDLPAPRSGAAVAVLSSTEILVIGGWSGHGKVNTVYKGTLHLNL